VRLTVVGCAGSFAGPRSAASCYLVSADDADGRTWNVVVDLGSGAFGSLQRYLDPFAVDAVALSHMHPDHCADLTGLHVYLRYRPQSLGGPRAAADRLTVWGPQDAADRFVAIDGHEPGTCAFDFAAWEPGVAVRLGPLVLEPFEARHPVPAVSLRITGPSDVDPTASVTLAYTGDTDVCEGVRAASHGADVLLSEAAFVQGRDDHIAGLHLTGAQAGEIAATAGAGRLLLTHLPSWNEPEVTLREARGTYDGDVEVVTAGATYAW